MIDISTGEEVLEGRSIDYYHKKGFEGKKEVQEGMSIDCGNTLIGLVRQEEEEGRSIDYDNSITQSIHQEEEEALINPNWQDRVFHRHTVEYAVMRFPWWRHNVSIPFLFQFFKNRFEFVPNHFLHQNNIFQIDSVH